jgi:SnoaL-like domain
MSTTQKGSLSEHAVRIIDALESINDRGTGVVELLAEVYAEEVVFQDSVHLIHGKRAFLEMSRSFASRSRSFRYTVDRQSAAELGDNLFFPWVWEFTGRIGPTVRVEGATNIRIRDKLVVAHRDYYDVLGSMLDPVPVAASAYRALMRMLG